MFNSIHIFDINIPGLTRAAAFEMGAHGITCNAICPGVCNTEMAQKQFQNADGARLDNAGVLKSIPVGRLGEVDDVANAALFLASEASSYMTGACMDVNGGNIML